VAVAVVINAKQLYSAISASMIVLIFLGLVKGLYAITLLHKLFFPILGHDNEIDDNDDNYVSKNNDVREVEVSLETSKSHGVLP